MARTQEKTKQTKKTVEELVEALPSGITKADRKRSPPKAKECSKCIQIKRILKDVIVPPAKIRTNQKTIPAPESDPEEVPPYVK